MAKSLQEILSPEVFEPILKRMLDAPVHGLENVDGDPKRVRVVCLQYLAWDWPTATKLVSDMEQVQPVTCPKCLALMAKAGAKSSPGGQTSYNGVFIRIDLDAETSPEEVEADKPIVVDVDWNGKPVRRADDGGTPKP